MRVCRLIAPILLAFGAQIASADIVNITSDNSAGALCSVAIPCGTVTVTGSSTLHVSILMNSPFGIFSNNDAFGFNVSGPTAGVSMSNFSDANFDGNGGAGNEDGWGDFEFRVDGPGGSGAVSALSFDVTRTGTPFTDPSDIEVGATGGNGFTVFGLHVRNNDTGLTGFAGVGGITDLATVPEPSSIVLLGTMLIGAATVLKRRRRK